MFLFICGHGGIGTQECFIHAQTQSIGAIVSFCGRLSLFVSFCLFFVPGIAKCLIFVPGRTALSNFVSVARLADTSLSQLSLFVPGVLKMSLFVPSRFQPPFSANQGDQKGSQNKKGTKVTWGDKTTPLGTKGDILPRVPGSKDEWPRTTRAQPRHPMQP